MLNFNNKHYAVCLTLLFMILTNQIFAQVLTPHPIPKLVITSANINTLGYNISHSGEIETSGILNITPSQNMEVKSAKKITFKAGANITPSTNANFKAYIDETALDVVWYTPNTTPGTVGRYEKLELGVKLPSIAEQQIDNFIADNGQTALNPFNPDDIDIKAEFWYYFQVMGSPQWVGPITRYGFYYKEFARNTVDPDPNNWDWVEQVNDYRFRIRFAPPEVGMWRCRVTANINNVGVFVATDFTFNCVPSSNKGFVTVSSNNNKYLKLGNESFFPVGQNLPSPSCFRDETSGYPQYCDTNSYNAWNCGEMSANVYMLYLEELEKLKLAGANYYRLIDFPWSYQIEFEELNNYYDRMNKAWEFDKLVEKTESLDLKMHFNLMYGIELMDTGLYNLRCWDWTENTTGNTDEAFCYADELGLQEPIEFLTNASAKRYYKHRLRYIVSRWGYSTSIAIIELMSEIDQPYTDDLTSPNYHPDNANQRYLWQNEMAYFLKNNLSVNQLLAVSYAKWPYDIVNHATEIDQSYSSPYIDVITKNLHAANVSRKGSIETCVGSINGIGFRDKHKKPFILSEIGIGDEAWFCENQVKWRKDAWLTTFSGLASTPMNWNEKHNYVLWHHYGNIRSFIGNMDFDDFTEEEIENENKVEMMCIKDETNNHQKAIGVFSNNTWNYYTDGDAIAPCNSFPFFNTANNNNGEDLKPIENIYYSDNKVKIEGMGFKNKFKIEWYDALNYTYITTTNKKSSVFGKLRLEHPVLTGSRPLIAFKVYRESDGEFKSSENETDTVVNTIYNLPTDSVLNNFVYTPWSDIDKTKDDETDEYEAEQLTKKIDIFPNPTTGDCTIKFDGKIKNAIFYLISYDGIILMQEKWTENRKTIDMSVFSASIYFVIIKNEKELYTNKIIKQ
jgi:hypothetical protein